MRKYNELPASEEKNEGIWEWRTREGLYVNTSSSAVIQQDGKAIHACDQSGAPNDGFLPNALKRCFRLSGVLLKLCRLILDCAIKFYLFGFSRGTVVFPNLLGLFCPFPENLRSYFLYENPS